MLKQAKIKAFEAGLEINFIEADIRTLNLQEKFDLIFIPFNSIHHLYKNEDLFRAFNVVKNHLKEGGLFLLDCFNPNIQYIVEGEKEQKEIAAYTTDDGREVLIKQTMRYENKTQINRIEWHYFINGEFNSIQNLDMRMFFPQELDSYLEWSGFDIIHKYGGFEEEVLSIIDRSSICTEDTVVIVESSLDTEIPDFEKLKVVRVKEYKTNKHTFLMKTVED